jgi:surface polysaccharide O-acyltransferase-like enzyme
MLFIVIYHFCIHAIDTNSPYYPQVVKGIEVILHIAVVCFVLISGYWGIKPSLKGLIKFYLQCLIYSVGIYLIYCVFNTDTFSKKTLVESFFAFTHTPGLWFVTTYICLYIISPIINIPLKIQSPGKKLVWIALLGILSFYFGLVHGNGSLIDGKNVINFIFIYYIGNFIHYHIDHNKIKQHRTKIILIYSLLNIFIFISIIATSNYLIIQEIIIKFFFPYNSIGLIINAILFFLIFVSFEFKSKLINWMGSSTFAIYLIHENGYTGQYLYKFIAYLHSNINNLFILGLSLVLFGIFVCIVCILIDKILKPILKIVESILFKSVKLQVLDKNIYKYLNSNM